MIFAPAITSNMTSAHMGAASHPWEWMRENHDQLEVVLNVGLLGAAIITAWFGISTLRQTKRDSRDRTRPYVYADVVPSLGGPGVWDLVVTNAGQSMARNLTLEIDNWPDDPDDVTESIHTLATTPRNLAPGARLRAFWRFDNDARPGMPQQATITTHYGSDDPKSPIYRDSNLVILDKIGHTPMAREGPEPPTNMDPDLKAIHKALRVISSSIRELGR